MDSAIEPVSNSAHADQEPWLCRLRLDLLAQGDDVVIDDTIAEKRSRSPGFVEQLFTCQNAASIASER